MTVTKFVLALCLLALIVNAQYDEDVSPYNALEKRAAMRNALVRFGRSGMRNALVRFGKRATNDYLEAKRAQSAPEPFVRFGRSAPSQFAFNDYYPL